MVYHIYCPTDLSSCPRALARWPNLFSSRTHTFEYGYRRVRRWQLGSLLGGLLAREHEVTLVARPAQARTLRDGGLRLTGEFDDHVTPAVRPTSPDSRLTSRLSPSRPSIPRLPPPNWRPARSMPFSRFRTEWGTKPSSQTASSVPSSPELSPTAHCLRSQVSWRVQAGEPSSLALDPAVEHPSSRGSAQRSRRLGSKRLSRPTCRVDSGRNSPLTRESTGYGAYWNVKRRDSRGPSSRPRSHGNTRNCPCRPCKRHLALGAGSTHRTRASRNRNSCEHVVDGPGRSCRSAD